FVSWFLHSVHYYVKLQPIPLLCGTNFNNKTLVGWTSCPPVVYLITPESAVYRLSLGKGSLQDW
ncbi:MAG: hypothetical protein ACKO86_30075, partial [Dolichospermum sp.]